jgi:ABC-type phosphate/phosphonate transport system substrate-binding protein
MFSVSTLLSPAHAEEQEKALNFGIISTESQQNLKPQWEPFLKDMEKTGRESERLLRPGLRRDHPGHAL